MLPLYSATPSLSTQKSTPILHCVQQSSFSFDIRFKGTKFYNSNDKQKGVDCTTVAQQVVPQYAEYIEQNRIRMVENAPGIE